VAGSSWTGPRSLAGRHLRARPLWPTPQVSGGAGRLGWPIEWSRTPWAANLIQFIKVIVVEAPRGDCPFICDHLTWPSSFILLGPNLLAK